MFDASVIRNIETNVKFKHVRIKKSSLYCNTLQIQINLSMYLIHSDNSYAYRNIKIIRTSINNIKKKPKAVGFLK